MRKKKYASRHFIVSYYIGREFLFSFIVSFLFFFFIFFINQLLLLAEEILSKHVPFKEVFLLIIYSFPLIISLSVPFASLVGALMAVGRFSSDNEVLALRSLGIPKKKILFPLVIMGTLLFLFSFSVNDYYLPKGTINFMQLYRHLLYSNPEIELESYSIKRYQTSTIVTGKIEGKNINNITIFDQDAEKNKRVITAINATLSDSKDQQGVISLKLSNVFIQTTDSVKKDRFEYFTADNMIYNILLKDISFSIKNPGPGEMSSIDVYKTIQGKSKRLKEKLKKKETEIEELLNVIEQEYYSSIYTLSDGESYESVINRLSTKLTEYEKAKSVKIRDRAMQMYQLEFHKKFAVPFACIVFIIFAFPVGLFTKRSGRSVGFGIGLLMSALYWSLLFAGQTLGLRGGYSPFLSMWAPNFIMLVLGAIFYLLRLKR